MTGSAIAARTSAIARGEAEAAGERRDALQRRLNDAELALSSARESRARSVAASEAGTEIPATVARRVRVCEDEVAALRDALASAEGDAAALVAECSRLHSAESRAAAEQLLEATRIEAAKLSAAVVDGMRDFLVNSHLPNMQALRDTHERGRAAVAALNVLEQQGGGRDDQWRWSGELFPDGGIAYAALQAEQLGRSFTQRPR